MWILRGHVTSFLWKWKLYDFAFKKRLVGHILKQNKSDLGFSNTHHFLKTSKFVAGRVAKMWFLKLWITSFWTETLHFLLKRWCGNVYSTSECNYQKFNKIQTKSSFGRHVGVQEYALLYGSQYKSYYFVEKSKCHKISPLKAFPLSGVR